VLKRNRCGSLTGTGFSPATSLNSYATVCPLSPTAASPLFASVNVLLPSSLSLLIKTVDGSKQQLKTLYPSSKGLHGINIVQRLQGKVKQEKASQSYSYTNRDYRCSRKGNVFLQCKEI